MKYLQLTALLFCLLGISCSSQQNKESSVSRVESLEAEEFRSQLGLAEVQLIDVRTPREFATGYIDGAINIDVTSKDFEQQLATLDKSRTVAVYCASGGRSKRAASRLEAYGFEKILELNTGINGWSQAQFPLKHP